MTTIEEDIKMLNDELNKSLYKYLDIAKNKLGNDKFQPHLFIADILKSDIAMFNKLSKLVSEEGVILQSSEEGGNPYVNPLFTALLATKKSIREHMSSIANIYNNEEITELDELIEYLSK